MIPAGALALDAFATIATNLATEAKELLWMGLAFALLAFMVKRRRAMAAAR